LCRPEIETPFRDEIDIITFVFTKPENSAHPTGDCRSLDSLIEMINNASPMSLDGQVVMMVHFVFMMCADNQSESWLIDDLDFYWFDDTQEESKQAILLNPVEAVQSVEPVHHMLEQLQQFGQRSDPGRAARRRRIRNRVLKGRGHEAKSQNPDPDDYYPFEERSQAFERIRALSVPRLKASEVKILGDMLEHELAIMGLPCRSRLTKRRMANGYA
jgi:hypothetical protein